MASTPASRPWASTTYPYVTKAWVTMVRKRSTASRTVSVGAKVATTGSIKYPTLPLG